MYQCSPGPSPTGSRVKGQPAYTKCHQTVQISCGDCTQMYTSFAIVAFIHYGARRSCNVLPICAVLTSLLSELKLMSTTYNTLIILHKLLHAYGDMAMG